MEERRRQREAEEAVRLAVEQEEERRVAQERELLQKQYQLDTQRKRHTEVRAHGRYTSEHRAHWGSISASISALMKEMTSNHKLSSFHFSNLELYYKF